MGLLDLLQAAAGEASLNSALGKWRQAVSGAIETVQSQIGSLQAALSSIRTAIGVSDEGIPLGDFTDFDFIGAGVTVTPGPDETAIVSIPAIGVSDEGVQLGNFTDFDFIGAGVTVTPGPGDTAVVFIPSGGGGFPGYGGAPPNVSTASSAGVSLLVSRSDHTHGHGDQPGGTLHAVATPIVAGFMSATDKAALDALVAGGPFVPSSRNLTAGAGMTGGGDLSADRTFDIVAADTTITVNANSIQVGIVPVGQVSGAVPATRTLTAGAGLTGGGDLSADRTFDVGAPADGSIVVGADAIGVNAVIQSGAASGATAVQPARTLTAGAGLTGGGDLSADRTFDVGATDTSIVVAADGISVSAAIQSGASSGSTAVQPSRQVIAGAGLTGGGDLSADRTFDVVANADGSIVVAANDVKVGVLATDAQHGNRGGGALHANATTSVAGFMSAADKAKLDAVAFSNGQMLFSPVDYMTGESTFVRNGGNFTTGIGFQVTSSVTINGVRFYWVRNASDRTIKCSIFSGGNANLTTVDLAVTATGYYSVNFAAPLVVTQADALGGLYLKVAVWDKSGNDYTRFSGNPGIVPTFPWVGGGKIIWKNWNAFAAGDASPTGSGTEYYPVEPIFA